MMDVQEARVEIRERYMGLTPEQFEQFCKILTEEVEGPAYIQLTPFQGDRGLDLQGYIGHEFVDVKFGGQVKQYSDNIGGPSIRTFVGSLTTNKCNVGSYITSSSFRDNAHEEVSDSNIPITLIDGDDILNIMLEYQLGVIYPNPDDREDLKLDPEFWEIFDETTGDELIPSDKVPQANKIPYLNIVLQAIDQGYRYKPEIRDYMKTHTNKEWRSRQADYYAMAGWALNYVHKDTMGEYRGEKMRRWGLTRDGQEYVKLLQEDRAEEAETHLIKHIREMEIMRRLLPEIQEQDEVSNDELKDLFFKEVALNRTTSDRRVSTVGQWLQMLPEINRKHTKNTVKYEYLTEKERLL